MRIRRLIILRHGQTEYNLGLRMQGQLDTTLTEHGRQQAHTTAKMLARMNPLRIISSDLQRAYDTAMILAAYYPGVRVDTDERLREMHLGHWQGLTRHQIDELSPGQWGRWKEDPTLTPPGGENRLQVACRTQEVVTELLETQHDWGQDPFPDRPIILVAHGGVTATLTAALLGLPVQTWPSLGGMGNASWTQLSAHPQQENTPLRWKLDIWNASAQVVGDVV